MEYVAANPIKINWRVNYKTLQSQIPAQVTSEYLSSRSSNLLNEWRASNRTSVIENVQKIEAFGQLAPGWNGYDAEPISADIIRACTGYIKQLDIQPDIFPTARNSVQFEYEYHDGRYLEVEIFENDQISVFRVDSNGQEFEEDNISWPDAISIITRFHTPGSYG